MDKKSNGYYYEVKLTESKNKRYYYDRINEGTWSRIEKWKFDYEIKNSLNISEKVEKKRE